MIACITQNITKSDSLSCNTSITLNAIHTYVIKMSLRIVKFSCPSQVAHVRKQSFAGRGKGLVLVNQGTLFSGLTAVI